MDEITRSLVDAFDRVFPILKSFPDLLAARLARRRGSEMGRPPRSTCVAVRASDRRMSPWNTAMCPQHHVALHRAHEVILTAELLRELCRPVKIPGGGLDSTEVAKLVGCHPETLRYAMRTGRFAVRYVAGLGGKRGKPVPVLSSRDLLDPTAANDRIPDEVHGCLWQYLAEQLPADLGQAVQRIPVLRPYRHSTRFRGWAWICPACRKPARTIFYPVRHLSLPDYYAVDPATHPADEVPLPPPTFACARCHRLRYFSRIDRNAWNCLVAHWSGGLLYGSEVQKPAWLTPDRKRAYRPTTREPSRRRQQVLTLLTTTDLPASAIAEQLGVTFDVVHSHATKLYRQYGVHTRAALREAVARSTASQTSECSNR